MPFPEFDPVLIHLGPLPIRWYALAYIAGIVLGWWYASRIIKTPRLWAGGKPPITGPQLDDLVFWLVLGVILGGRMADALRARIPAGRILVILFGIIAPILPIWIGFTTTSSFMFYFMNFLAGMFAATALGAAAATTQDLVLPRMRGTATAAFFLATTLVGLAIGPYMVGQISDLTGSMRTGVLSLIGVAPISIILLIYAYRALPQAEATIVERARTAV